MTIEETAPTGALVLAGDPFTEPELQALGARGAVRPLLPGVWARPDAADDPAVRAAALWTLGGPLLAAGWTAIGPSAAWILAGGAAPSQALLMPEVVELDEPACDRLEAAAPDLKALGLEAERFGPAAMLVRGVPAALGQCDARALLAEADRDAYRRQQAALEREKEIMKDVKGWEVCIHLCFLLLYFLSVFSDILFSFFEGWKECVSHREVSGA